MLPQSVSVLLRERLRSQGRLDYAQHEIRLALTSLTELETRLHSCRKEPETVAWLERVLVSGSVLYDIGANVGAYSLVAAARLGPNGRVYAFEPGHSTFMSLAENISINGFQDRVIPLQVALAAHNHLARFRLSSLEAGGARHAGLAEQPAQHGPGNELTQTLPAFRLDDLRRTLGLEDPTCMKIDVDGGEESVLAGAVETLCLSTLRDVLIEIDEEETSVKGVSDALQHAGFRLLSDHPRGTGTIRNYIWSKPT